MSDKRETALSEISRPGGKEAEAMFSLVGFWILGHVCNCLQHFRVVDLGVGSRGRNLGVEDSSLQDRQVNALLDSGGDVVPPETVSGNFIGEASGLAAPSKRLRNRPGLQPSGLGKQIACCTPAGSGHGNKEGTWPIASPAGRPMTDDPQTFSRNPAPALASAFCRHYLDISGVEIDMPQIESSHRSDPEPGGEQDSDDSCITSSGRCLVDSQGFSQGEHIGPGQSVHISGSPRSVPGILDGLDLSPNLRVHLARPGQAACDLFQGSRQESGTGAIGILLTHETKKLLNLVGIECVPWVLEDRWIIETRCQIAQAELETTEHSFPTGWSERGEVGHDRIFGNVVREVVRH